jgi:hypothetical protein
MTRPIMRKIALTGSAAALLMACALLGGAADNTPVEVRSKNIGSKYVIVGALGKPLGTYVTVSGVHDPRPLMASPFLVDTIDGQKLHGTVLLEVQGEVKELAEGRYVFRGYENGGMSGTPVEPDYKGPLPQKAYHFATWFVVTQVKEQSAPPKP